ncbi:hypothetical protein AVEN_124847-1 [Araneus ventricosus]|uniref:Uncharacterized protein n=1 Tax=Araneus ventricosus TaxID=182803 RepID=A0A4Y2TD16_ARAVE|nr:hypothetical protein AVEN_124847-1 [Araneus ventricosus]
MSTAAMAICATRSISGSAGVWPSRHLRKKIEGNKSGYLTDGPCDGTITPNRPASNQPVSCIGTVKDSCSGSCQFSSSDMLTVSLAFPHCDVCFIQRDFPLLHGDTNLYPNKIGFNSLNTDPRHIESSDGLVERSQLRDRRVPGSKPGSTEDPPLMWDCCKLNHT